MEEERPKESAPRKWALLIGVDFYMPGRVRWPNKVSNLNGCVNDVKLMKDYLLCYHGFDAAHITKLTSSIDPTKRFLTDEAYERLWETLESTHGVTVIPTAQQGIWPTDVQVTPLEDKNKWPTYENMIKAFESITDKASPGDIVFIHYSGHGGRAVTLVPEHKPSNPHRSDHPGIDETLVPPNFNCGGKYLRDFELAVFLRRMTAKRLRVTVVLDCCHSGGATRNIQPQAPSHGIRQVFSSSRNGPTTHRRDQDVSANPRLRHLISHVEYGVDWVRRPGDESILPRDEILAAMDLATSVRSWQPQGWVAITACMPSQYAHETCFEGKSHGELTSKLVDTLRRASKGPITNAALFRRVEALVIAATEMRGTQNPMFFLQTDDSTFLWTQAEIDHSIPVTYMNNNFVRLGAGSAHGVGKGDTFATYPWRVSSWDDIKLPAGTIQVTTVNDMDSEAIIVERPDSLEAGAHALLLKKAFARVLLLNLDPPHDISGYHEQVYAEVRDFDFEKNCGRYSKVVIADGGSQGNEPENPRCII
ncbi:Metacaspase-1 [Apiospora rasikravindrae]|uniref:Metacaspase-1 n=1 Tax=Apiospora rasikravindrae TaxID=990691 RepID=A0ABR1U0P6_9PEZI